MLLHLYMEFEVDKRDSVWLISQSNRVTWGGFFLADELGWNKWTSHSDAKKNCHLMLIMDVWHGNLFYTLKVHGPVVYWDIVWPCLILGNLEFWAFSQHFEFYQETRLLFCQSQLEDSWRSWSLFFSPYLVA